jgi:uncharacterized protein (TIGR00369 family)
MSSEPDQFQRMIQSQRFLDRIPHMGALGVQLVDFAPGRVTVRLPYRPEIVGNPDTGVIAGGAISALLDNACGSAVVAKVARPNAFATLDLRIDYMKPATPGRDVLAFAECYKVTRLIAFVRGYAYQDTPAEPIANAAATFMFTGRGTLPQADGA